MKKFLLNFKGFYKLLIGLILLDQISKLLVYFYRPDVVSLNRGIAFSLPLQLDAVILISIVVIVGISWLLWKKKIEKSILWAMFLAGALGNLIDRVWLNSVIDFISIPNLFVFNVADVYLNLSAIMLIYVIFKETYE